MDPKPWWMKHISLEPAYFLYTVACILLQFGNTNLYLQKACRHNATKEPNLSTPCEDKENGVLFVANVNAYASSTKMLFIMLSVIISCSWSDRAGKKRKLFLMSAMIGQLLESAFGYVHSYYWTLDVKFGVLTSALSQIIFGNVLTFKTFGFMYLADVVTPTNRTMRFGIFTAVTTLATLLAKLISGFLLHACGFCQYYSICCGISLLAIIFGHLCIEDTSIPVQKKPSFCSVLNIKGHITESAKIILGKRDKKMVTALLLMAIYCVVQFSHDVEPSYFFYTIAFIMLDFGNTNLYLQKACRINTTSEPDLDTPCDDTEKGVTTVASVNTHVLSVKMFLVLTCTALYSSWSDLAGRKRKFFLLMAPVTILLESAIQCCHVYWWSLPAMYAAISSAALQVVFGHTIMMSAFGFMYLSDTVDLKNRTMRLGIFASLKLIGIMIGRGISGFLLHSVGFYRYYATCFVLSLISLILGFVCIEDISVPVERKISLCSVHSFSNLFRSFKIILGKGNTNERITKYLLLMVFCILVFVHEGQLTVVYLYLKYRFDWNEVMYSLFLFYGCIGTVVGTLFSSVILSKLFKVHDALIGIVAALWDAGIAISYIFAFENWQLYLVSGLDIFFGVSTTVCVSLLTKFYDTSEMGHLFAVKQMFNLSIPFCHPVYNLLFKSTLHTLPTAFYFVSFGLYLVAVILYCIIYVLERSGRKNYTKE